MTVHRFESSGRVLQEHPREKAFDSTNNNRAELSNVSAQSLVKDKEVPVFHSFLDARRFLTKLKTEFGISTDYAGIKRKYPGLSKILKSCGRDLEFSETNAMAVMQATKAVGECVYGFEDLVGKDAFQGLNVLFFDFMFEYRAVFSEKLEEFEDLIILDVIVRYDVAYPAHRSLDDLKRDFYHELFHYFDFRDGDRAESDHIWQKLFPKKRNQSDAIDGYARQYSKKNAAEDRATIAEVLLSESFDNRELREIMERTKKDVTLRRKIEFITGCKIEKGLFVRDYLAKEYKALFGTPFRYFAKWTRANGTLKAGYEYWNSKFMSKGTRPD